MERLNRLCVNDIYISQPHTVALRTLYSLPLIEILFLLYFVLISRFPILSRHNKNKKFPIT